MPEIKLNNRIIQAKEGATILTTAQAAGIPIPTMCWLKTFKPSTSCMVCLVQDLRNGKMLTACSAVVEAGMDISTDNEAVLDMRKSAIELLLSEHNGDCEAPCQRVCPAEMDIPRMNRLIAANRFDEALALVKETIALPAVLGYICPAPCEKACRRKDIDQAVSICLLKRFVAEADLGSAQPFTPPPVPSRNTKVAIVGAGPTGLATAFYLAKQGFTCHVYDAGEQPGGKLATDISADLLPPSVLASEVERIKATGVEFFPGQWVDTVRLATEIASTYPLIVWSVGAEKESVDAIGTDTLLASGFFEPTPPTPLKELTILSRGTSLIFIPKPLAAKSKMAVRAVGLGKRVSEWLIMSVENKPLTAPDKAFNSVYRPIRAEEAVEYLKEASNPGKREANPRHTDGFNHLQAVREAGRCLHCDCRKQDDCLLRQHATNFKASQRVYPLAHPRLTTKNTTHDRMVLEPLKCIKCGLCIQTALLEGDPVGFAFNGRGFEVQICIPIANDIQRLSEQTVLHCAQNCPTGAISLKEALINPLSNPLCEND